MLVFLLLVVAAFGCCYKITDGNAKNLAQKFDEAYVDLFNQDWSLVPKDSRFEAGNALDFYAQNCTMLFCGADGKKISLNGQYEIGKFLQQEKARGVQKIHIWDQKAMYVGDELLSVANLRLSLPKGSERGVQKQILKKDGNKWQIIFEDTEVFHD